jgi:hypothetical protein
VGARTHPLIASSTASAPTLFKTRQFVSEDAQRQLGADLSSTLHISGGVTERFSESLQQGDWNFYDVQAFSGRPDQNRQ